MEPYAGLVDVAGNLFLVSLQMHYENKLTYKYNIAYYILN